MTETQTVQERTSQALFGIGLGFSALVVSVWWIFAGIADIPKTQGVIWIPALSFLVGLTRVWYSSWADALPLCGGFGSLALIAYTTHLGLHSGWYVAILGTLAYHFGHYLLLKVRPKHKI